MFPETYVFNVLLLKNTFTLMFKYILCKGKNYSELYIQPL